MEFHVVKGSIARFGAGPAWTFARSRPNIYIFCLGIEKERRKKSKLSLSLSTRHSPLPLWNASPASETAASPPVGKLSLRTELSISLPVLGSVSLGLLCWLLMNEWLLLPFYLDYFVDCWVNLNEWLNECCCCFLFWGCLFWLNEPSLSDLSILFCLFTYMNLC
jgi:hypothetical protein